MLKVGDKLYCYNNYIFNETIFFFVGHTYIITMIDGIYIWVIDKHENYYLIVNFHDYFYTTKELRKIKLERINESK